MPQTFKLKEEIQYFHPGQASFRPKTRTREFLPTRHANNFRKTWSPTRSTPHTFGRWPTKVRRHHLPWSHFNKNRASLPRLAHLQLHCKLSGTTNMRYQSTFRSSKVHCNDRGVPQGSILFLTLLYPAVRIAVYNVHTVEQASPCTPIIQPYGREKPP